MSRFSSPITTGWRRSSTSARESKRATILVAMHSFTPVYAGVARPWHIGTLYNRDKRLAKILLALLHAEGDLVVGDNQPYAASDATDYCIPVHAEPRGLIHSGIEIRQDLIGDEAGQKEWAERLTRIFRQAERSWSGCGSSGAVITAAPRDEAQAAAHMNTAAPSIQRHPRRPAQPAPGFSTASDAFCGLTWTSMAFADRILRHLLLRERRRVRGDLGAERELVAGILDAVELVGK